MLFVQACFLLYVCSTTITYLEKVHKREGKISISRDGNKKYWTAEMKHELSACILICSLGGFIELYVGEIKGKVCFKCHKAHFSG